MFFPIPPAGVSGPKKSLPKLPNLVETIVVRNSDLVRFKESDFELSDTLSLINDLGSDDNNKVIRTKNELSKRKDDEHLVTALIRLVGNKDADIVSRRASAYVLGNLNDISAIFSLAGILKEEDSELVENSIDALETLFLNNKSKVAQTTIDHVAEKLTLCVEEHEDPYVSLDAAMLLGQLGKVEAVEMLADCLANDKEGIADNERGREKACNILCEIKHEKTLEYIVPLCDYDEYTLRTREYAETILSKLVESNIGITNNNTIDNLMKYLDDPNARVSLRRIVVKAIGNVKSNKGPVKLKLREVGQKDRDSEVRESAGISIVKLLN